MHIHRVKHFDYIAALPRFSGRHVARRVRLFHHGVAVYDHLEFAFLDPVRVTNLHVERAGAGNGELGTFTLRECGLLLDLHVLRLPIQDGCGKEVHVKLVAVFGVNKLVVLGRVFHARTHATPHGCIHLGIHAVMAGTCRSEVHVPAMFWMYCG